MDLVDFPDFSRLYCIYTTLAHIIHLIEDWPIVQVQVFPSTTLKQIELNIRSLHLRFLVLSSVFDSIKIFLRSHPYTDLLPAVIKVLATDVDWQTANTTSSVYVW